MSSTNFEFILDPKAPLIKRLAVQRKPWLSHPFKAMLA